MHEQHNTPSTGKPIATALGLFAVAAAIVVHAFVAGPGIEDDLSVNVRGVPADSAGLPASAATPLGNSTALVVDPWGRLYMVHPNGHVQDLGGRPDSIVRRQQGSD